MLLTPCFYLVIAALQEKKTFSNSIFDLALEIISIKYEIIFQKDNKINNNL